MVRTSVAGLIVKNIGFIGNPSKYSPVIGENEEESPWARNIKMLFLRAVDGFGNEVRKLFGVGVGIGVGLFVLFDPDPEELP